MKRNILLLTALLLAACTNYLQEEPHMSVEITSELGNVLLSGNPIFVDVTATPPAAVTSYTTLLRITSTDGALVGSPIIDTVAPGADNIAHYNIQARVDQAVDYNFEFPQVNKRISHEWLAFDITLEAGETYIDASGDKQTTWSGVADNHRILKGGLSHLKQMEILPENFYDDFIMQGRWLTWQPNNAIISPIQPLKFWYIYYETTPELYNLSVAVEYESGAVAGDVEQISLSPSRLYEFNTNLSLWGIEAIDPDEGKAVYMEISLYKIGSPKQETRTFYFDHNYYEQNTFIYFKNSIAGIDCLWCTGKVTQLINTNTTMGTRPDTPEMRADLKQATQVVSSITGQRKWQINTGHKSKAELAELRDFVLSEQMWLVDGDYTIPVYLENREQVLAQLARNLDDISFTLLEGHIEKYY